MHTRALPLITPGVLGVLVTVTASVRAAEDPQKLLATTVMLPLVALATVEMEVDVEVPVHAPGNVHV